MNPVYKIETYSGDCAAKIASFITRKRGHCVIQGSAVVTDYCFKAQSSLELLPLISFINDNVSESDIYHLNSLNRVAA